MKIRFIYGLTAIAMMALLAGCSESEAIVYDNPIDDSDIIHIGGIDCDVVSASLADYTTRAAGDNESVDAETEEWLLGPLFGGLDITYGQKGKEAETQRVAILRLLKKDGATGITKDDVKYSGYPGADGEKIAEYSFKYRTSLGEEGEDAIWYDNGAHYFQGVYVPDKLRYDSETETPEAVNGATSQKAPNLKLDQSKNGNDDNYTLLARYLGMPADASIHATVGRVKLPFRHRLARVLAYVLIDPTMGNDVKIQGYNLVDGRDDASTSEIKFCNVDVLVGVEENDDATGHATLTPHWDTSRKVIPHFVEESGSKNKSGEVVNADNFIMFYNTEEKEYIFPTDDEDWVAANTKWNNAYTTALSNYQADDTRRESKAAEDADKNSKLKRTKYGKVPVYDLIVRPTYKSEDMVMYDEDLTGTSKEALVTLTNNIDFEITLSNGLEYTKQFKFDLDANYQTIVYLRITREHIDYNSSGADKWMDETSHDGYYGVNNQNGNTLSYAGSSWQRAYRIGSKTDDVTDGHWYGKDDTTDDDDVQDDDSMPWYPQYVSEARWIEMFAEAYKGGLHHGDYFILDNDIEIDATLLPDNFVFTGHLDGQDHKITLTGTNTDWEEWFDATTTDYANESITLYTAKNKANVFTMPSPLFSKNPVYYSSDELTEVNGTSYVTSTLRPVYKTYTAEEAAALNAEHAGDPDWVPVQAGDEKTPQELDHYEVTSSSIQATTETIKEYIYSQVTPSRLELLTSADGTYYTRSGEEGNYTYSPFNPSEYHFYTVTDHTSGSTLFAGLNGAYDAAIGEANVHSETQNGHTVLVPYVDSETHTGWRAEVINTKITGADMFPDDVIVNGSYDVTKVSGYIYNCWKIADDGASEKIKPHTPTLPKYK